MRASGSRTKRMALAFTPVMTVDLMRAFIKTTKSMGLEFKFGQIARSMKDTG
jgi:hypothetical protein